LNKRRLKLCEEFRSRVETLLGDFFTAKGLVLDEVIPDDQCSRYVLVYRSPACKVAIYYSMHDGEVNCVLGSLGSDNRDVDGDGWTYIRELQYKGREPSIEELLAAVSPTPRAGEVQLQDIVGLLKDKFDEFVKSMSVSAR
jgi:hypothetical protein